MEKRTFFSTDLSKRGATAAAVIRPDAVEKLAEAVRLCGASGVAVIPRGGGFSYTGGYLPAGEDSVMVDMRAFDRVIEINEDDMYVVVETGCTWHRLYEALKAKGLRTPYFGPMSGYGATVGGALSQGSFFLGSSQYGPVAESVLAVEVVLADGRVLRSGSWGGTGDPSPFYRTYGPDFTGLFLGDTGAFGLKTKAVLKLLPFPAHQAFASFAFNDESQAMAAVTAIGRLGIAAECYCWDPYFVKVMATATAGLAEDLKILAGVARGGGSMARGIFNAARLAAAGKRNFDGQVFMLNLTVDDPTSVGAEARMRLLKQQATEAGGREMPPSAPMAMRGTPFIAFNTAERRRPLRNLPTHGLAPHSRLAAVSHDVREMLDGQRAAMIEVGVECGVIYFGVGVQAVCMEPVFYWDDHQYYHHNRVEESSDLSQLDPPAPPPAATQLVASIRESLVAIFRKHGCAHVQIGKSYPWLDTRAAPLHDLAMAMKAAVDPRRLVNPGSLGL
ncbi:FAD-binding oxidoreductase [Sphingomonas sp. AR_OL41]|uniref:FAD-binding oxidoreductase n=1 Tax=Sphingomonas sp. AR_OL41 TaxID=3042729 RepID=UPI002480E616|nr:FAD-binding oxidoreductase [Sphingomonas sp. AR_OL41]MDH7973263.1 FAD-binding oxidoreductase [Sphingomonas sp. AR_OL41]